MSGCEPELERCPNCASAVQVRITIHPERGTFYGTCDSCRHTGPESAELAPALAAWNQNARKEWAAREAERKEQNWRYEAWWWRTRIAEERAREADRERELARGQEQERARKAAAKARRLARLIPPPPKPAFYRKRSLRYDLAERLTGSVQDNRMRLIIERLYWDGAFIWQVAQELGVSYERVRQIRDQGVQAMRREYLRAADMDKAFARYLELLTARAALEALPKSYKPSPVWRRPAYLAAARHFN